MALTGRIRVPSDKSISHRAVLFSGIAHGVSHVSDLLASDDVLRSLEAIRALGARVEVEEGAHGLNAVIEGIGMSCPIEGELDIDCGNSGTTARLLMGLLSGLRVTARLHGDASLSTRPMERVMQPLCQMGARFAAEGGTLPVTTLGTGPLRALDYRSSVSSAQVKTAILLAGLFAHGTTCVSEPAKSRDHTELMLPAYGVKTHVDGLNVSLDGPAVLSACDMSVAADPSSATFVAVAAALLEESDVVIENVSLNPTRIGAFKVMERMGACISYENVGSIGAEPVGDVHVRYSPRLGAVRVRPDEIPTLIDEIPVLSLLAAVAQGESVFESCGELRVKESDRFGAICDMLDAFGIECGARGDDLVVSGASLSAASGTLKLQSHHDHRLAMTYYLAGLASCADVEVDDAACVSVSWPGFYSDIGTLLT